MKGKAGAGTLWDFVEQEQDLASVSRVVSTRLAHGIVLAPGVRQNVELDRACL